MSQSNDDLLGKLGDYRSLVAFGLTGLARLLEVEVGDEIGRGREVELFSNTLDADAVGCSRRSEGKRRQRSCISKGRVGFLSPRVAEGSEHLFRRPAQLGRGEEDLLRLDVGHACLFRGKGRSAGDLSLRT